ncbi:MAG: hypothetical protein ACR2GA_01560 [Chloroflexota bacterium]
MSIRLRPDQLTALERHSRRYHQRSIGATLGLLLEEKLREEEYAQVAFRDSGAGREAYVMGTGLAVWEIMLIARAYGNEPEKTGQHLGIPTSQVDAAFAYAAGFSAEIEAELAENDAMDFEALRRMLPSIQRMSASTST